MKIWAITFIFLFSCTKKKVEAADSQPIPDRGKLEQKYDLYIDLTDGVRDEHGFVDSCDGLLFTALGNIGGTSYDLSVAEGLSADDRPNALWHRTPDHDCYPRRSGSTISKDMFIGLLWESYHNRRLGRAERLFDYGSVNSWLMGEGEIGRVVLTPNLVALLARIIKSLGGSNHNIEVNYPVIWPSGLTGYQSHLQVLHILVRNDVDGSIDETMSARLSEHWDRSPGNALFSYAHHLFLDGDQTDTVNLLLEFPDRLPNGGDWCEHYKWERDAVKWKPCEDGSKEVYPGVDLILVAGLLLNGR